MEVSGEASGTQSRKRPHTSQACERCRSRRMKCDGDTPCAGCQRAASQCVYNSKDKRRREHRVDPATVDELLIAKRVLDEIWQATLRGDEQPHLDLIKSGASLRDVAQRLDSVETGGDRSAIPSSHDLNLPIASPSESLHRSRSKSSQGVAFSPLEEESSSSESAMKTTDPGSGSRITSSKTSANQGIIPINKPTWAKDQSGESPVHESLVQQRISWHPSLQIPPQVSKVSQNTHLQSSRSLSHQHQRLEHALTGSQTTDILGIRKHSVPGPSLAPTIEDSPSLTIDDTTKHSSNVTIIHPSQRHQRPSGSPRDFGNLPFSAAILANHFPPPTQQAQLLFLQQPEWKTLPHTDVDESPLGRVFTDFRRAVGALVRNQPSSQIENAPGLGLVNASLYFRDHRPTDPFDAETWASQMMRTFGNEFSHTAKLASLYVQSRFMRWLINPTPETYAAVPSVIRPTLRQRLIPHPSPIDLCVGPPLRDALIDRMRDFVGATASAGIDINWPHTVNDALICIRRGGSEGSDEDVAYYISPQFAAHVSNPDNWRFGRSLLEEFPELIGSSLLVSEDDIIEPVDRWL